MVGKKREITEEQYEKITYWSRRCVPQERIARRVGFTPEGFSKRKSRDATLRDALEGNFDEGAIGLHVSQYTSAINHYQTICRDCNKISEGGFYESCPICDKLDPAQKGEHTNVRHKFIKADTAMLIHLGKHILGQTDRALIEVRGSEEKPLFIRNMTEEELARKWANLLPFLNEKFGPKDNQEGSTDAAQP